MSDRKVAGTAMYVIVDLSALEIAVIRSWYEYVNEDSFHYGGARLLLPSEQMLLRKIGAHIDGPISFTAPEIEIISGWMDRSIARRYGDAKYLFGYESRVYHKLKSSVETSRVEP
jgi:hypothetical protein